MFGEGREYVDGSSSSLSDNEPRAARASSAADARTVEFSPVLDFGLFSQTSSFPEPTLTMAELAVLFGMKRSPYDRVVLVDFWRRGPLRDRLLLGVLQPVPVSAKSETPNSKARRGVWTPLAMFDFGESRCDIFEVDFVKCDDRFPPYTDLVATLSLSNVFLSGVKGEELLFDIAAAWARGEGVNGIRPPAVRVEKSPAWDLRGVDTAVAIVAISGMISVERQINVSIDDKRFGISNELQESQPNGSWMCLVSKFVFVLDMSKCLRERTPSRKR